MPVYDRSGLRLLTMKLGRWNCLRQEILAPGESFRPTIAGFIRLGALREQLLMPVHCKLCVFVAPLRWYDDYFS